MPSKNELGRQKVLSITWSGRHQIARGDGFAQAAAAALARMCVTPSDLRA
jgi:hypothetical protein